MLTCKMMSIIYKGLILQLFIVIYFTSNLYGENIMRPLYTLNRALTPKLEPQIYPTKKNEIKGIFDFPVDNAIATNMLPGTNAVTLISFNEKKLKVKYKTIAKNFKSYVGGGDTSYLPIFSEDTIGYSQTRGFSLLNVKNKKCNYYSIIGDTNYGIMHNEVVDSEKNIFLFYIMIFKSEKRQRLVRIMDLSTKIGEMISEVMINYRYLACANNTLFFYKDNEMQATDINFKEVDHPFISFFNEERIRFKDVTELIVHPTLPFAVFNDDEKPGIWVISWRDKDKPFMQKILSCESSRYKFSYDGKWMVFKEFLPAPGRYILLPVNSQLPCFLGKPIFLGDIPTYPSGKGTTAMTRNPPGFVVCERQREGLKKINILKKWDFTEAEKFLEKN